MKLLGGHRPAHCDNKEVRRAVKSYVAKKPYDSARRTRQTIRRTFLDLASELPFNKVSVREICKRMGITRTAFYYHYDDLYAVLDDILDEMVAATGIDDVFAAWTHEEQMPIDVPCKVTMDRIGNYVLSNDCRCLLTNCMLAGYLAKYIAAREIPVVTASMMEKTGVSEKAAEQMFRFVFAGVCFVYFGFDWTGQQVNDYHKEYIRQHAGANGLLGDL